jgi:hypothetical protein
MKGKSGSPMRLRCSERMCLSRALMSILATSPKFPVSPGVVASACTTCL